MRKSAIPSQIFFDTLMAQLSGTLQIWTRRWRFVDKDTISARDNEKPTELSLASRPAPVRTESIDAIRERSVPLIYLLLLALSGVALIMILLSDHFVLT
jgi:hypothetical protein